MNKILYILLISFIVAGCSQKWKETAKVDFDFEIYGTTPVNYGFWFTEGQVNVSRLTFEGNRLQSRSVAFEDNFESPILIDIPTGLVDYSLQYDLPQGTYREVRMEIFLESGADSTPSISLKGFFADSTGIIRDVLFYVSGKIESKLITQYPGDREDFSILSGDNYFSVIRLKLNDWFSSIPKSILEGAEISNVNGRETIVISDEHNVPIYSAILPKLGQFDEVQFE